PVGVCVSAHAQSITPTPVQASSSALLPVTPSAKVEERLEALSSSLNTAKQQLEQSRKEIEELRQELSLIKGQLPAARTVAPDQSNQVNNIDAAKTTVRAIEDLQGRQENLEEQVKVHEQIKIES